MSKAQAKQHKKLTAKSKAIQAMRAFRQRVANNDTLSVTEVHALTALVAMRGHFSASLYR